MSSKTEMNTADRIARYLLRRLERRAMRDVYQRAEARGLLERKRIPSAEGDIIGWQIPLTLPLSLTGHFRTDGFAIERVLARPVPVDLDPMADMSMDEDLTIGHTVDGTPVHLASAASSPREKYPTKEDRDASERGASIFAGADLKRDYVLLLIRACRAKPHVADAAVALLIARAVGETEPDLGSLLDVLRRPAPVIVMQTTVAEYEQRVGKMLERGLIMPFALSLVDAFGDRALGGRYRDQESDPHRVMTMSGKGLRDMSAQAIRDALAKASLHKTMPLIIADENASAEFPLRLLAAADLALQTGGIDRTLLAELLHVCLGVPPKTSLTTMETRDFQPGALGLDDLALALRPGRSVEEILAVLTALTAATEAEKDDEDEESSEGRGRSRKLKPRGRERLGRLTRSKGDGASDLTMPEPLPSDAEQNTSTTKYLSVETLSGYGQARVWALDLKADLALWRQGNLAWSDMSTKLLLSGPPGTGKTTFARALCNTLQVPMLAKSLATMLEPGYLGDVLKAMTSAFETACDHAPAILFVDEFENIGKRSAGGDKNAEYWNSVVNRMLELLDGATRTEGVIVVAATNFADRIDGALLRSGRLETRIDIPLPDTTALAGILEHHLGSDLTTVIGTQPRSSAGTQADVGQRSQSHALEKLRQGRKAGPVRIWHAPREGMNRREDWYDQHHHHSERSNSCGHPQTLALLATGMSGADIERLVREVRARCRRRGEPLTWEILDKALRRDDDGLSDAIRHRIAVHELGHALAYELTGVGKVVSVRIHGLGGKTEAQADRELNQFPEGVDASLICILAGRAAEAVVFGNKALGSGGEEGSDLALATRIAVDLETAFGSVMINRSFIVRRNIQVTCCFTMLRWPNVCIGGWNRRSVGRRRCYDPIAI